MAESKTYAKKFPAISKFRTPLVTCFSLLVLGVTQALTKEENKSTLALGENWGGLSAIFTSSPASGPIQDASCDVEQLELANDSQLHSILHELKQTAFFRTFAVDLDERCPLATFTKKAIEGVPSSSSAPPDAKTEPHSEQDEKKEEEEAGGTCEGNLPDLDPDAGSACGVKADNDSRMPWQKKGVGGFGALTGSRGVDGGFSASKKFGSASEPVMPPVAEDSAASKQPEGPLHDLGDNNDDNAASKQPEGPLHDLGDNNDGDHFECDGGPEDADPGAPPLCDLAEEDMDSSAPIRSLLTSALNTIKEQLGWESESQKDTFEWSSPSDPVIISESDAPCDDQLDGGILPDTFWVDMCSNIKAGEGLKFVNLNLNPERNTGYNGTHIWRAIYEENCLAVDGLPTAPMCYEERVLYRLLSGLHTSTTLSIAKNYYPPSKRKGRKDYEANPEYFMAKFRENPDHIRNLHFSYVVLLRALKKASPFLHNYEIRTGDIVDDETATVLLKRLLGSTILRSCNDVFTAFDESLMFNEEEAKLQKDEVISLQQNFKGVFHNISSILDCVQCQQCKLHGKMAMMGYGTALKVLFLPRGELIASSLSRNEIVAFINTIAKLSESIKEVRELTHMYWKSQTVEKMKKELPTTASIGASHGVDVVATDPVDAAVGAIAALSRAGRISGEREAELVGLALRNDPNLLVLAKYYASDLEKFLLHSTSIGELGGAVVANSEPDAIVVGSGLAGLSATLNILDRGGKVIVIEKEHSLGGNSNKASSGINGCCPQNSTYGDNLEDFKADTIKSAGSAAQLPLIEILVQNSEDAIHWLKERVGVDLSLLAQLGGHAHKRTHRPSTGMAGSEIIFKMQKAVKEYVKSGMVEILVDTKVTKLLTDDEGRVTGVEIKSLRGADGEEKVSTLTAPNVMLATGGFAADRRPDSYLALYRPELLKMPATAGEFSTGDGISLATALGAGKVDMDKVQIHPTGWVDPADPTKRSKILAAELMRGVGGLLINADGQRFCNELGTRAYVTDMMLGHDPHYAETKVWNATRDPPTFSLVLSSSAAADGKKHVDLYTHKGLLERIEGVAALAQWMGQDVATVISTLKQYQHDAENGVDEWGKASFRGVPDKDLENEVFYAGTVTPVLHYCMGGITIDKEGNVLDTNGNIIQGLHAAGEVAGGVHGNNRLGGNSLLECTVYGSIVGKKLPIQNRAKLPLTGLETSQNAKAIKLRDVTQAELQEHSTPEDCWVAVHGTVYDLTEFAEEHPPGAQSIYDLAGKDGTDAFQAVHHKDMLQEFEEDKVGVLIG